MDFKYQCENQMDPDQAAQKRYYQKNADRIRAKAREYSRTYREKNQDKVKQYQNEYHKTIDRSEYFREYYRKRKEGK